MINLIRRPSLAFLLFLTVLTAHSQAPAAIDSIQFFIDEKPIEMTISMDVKFILGDKSEKKDNYIPAKVTMKMPDSSSVTEAIRISTRGAVRRKICYMPPLKLNFHNSTSPRLYPLHSLKLVCGCKTSQEYEQYVLKEFLIYKMYNLLSDKSFRVRLAHVTYEDSKGKKKPIIQYAYFVESIEAMAKRNHCKEYKGVKLAQEETDRKQMTLVSVFQYMIANTDWAVPVDHNIRLINSKKDSTTAPFAVAYDFDYAGLVNTDYAVAEPKLEIESVTQRLYRGFPRTELELQQVFESFNQQKTAIYSLINNFEPLSARNKKDMTGYLDDFYKTINDKSYAKDVFIRGARKE